MAKADTDTVQGKQIRFQEGKTYLRTGHPLLRECPGYFQALGEVLEWPPKSFVHVAGWTIDPDFAIELEPALVTVRDLLASP